MISIFFSRIKNLIELRRHPAFDPTLVYEFCPRCEANLTLQKGYDNSLPYWKCLGCGEMLINPAVEADSGIVWRCDCCGAMLNIQPVFSEKQGRWKCTECGFENDVSAREVYVSEDEFRKELGNPYRGLKSEDLLELSLYEEVDYLGNHENVILVRHRETGKLFVKKEYVAYDVSIYQFLMNHPVAHVPRIVSLFEGKSSLIVIEEYLEGETLEVILEKGPLELEQAIQVTWKTCMILDELHHLDRPIVHRDVKPSNVMIVPDGEVWLLDVNVAKWHDPEKTDDTRHMGTWNYAAPEQVGYGMTASSPKTDVYAVGMLLNVMLTGAFPKEKQAAGPIRKIIDRCISLNAEERYTARGLAQELERL